MVSFPYVQHNHEWHGAQHGWHKVLAAGHWNSSVLMAIVLSSIQQY
jgi:hypothetical protein